MVSSPSAEGSQPLPGVSVHQTPWQQQGMASLRPPASPGAGLGLLASLSLVTGHGAVMWYEEQAREGCVWESLDRAGLPCGTATTGLILGKAKEHRLQECWLSRQGGQEPEGGGGALVIVLAAPGPAWCPLWGGTAPCGTVYLLSHRGHEEHEGGAGGAGGKWPHVE